MQRSLTAGLLALAAGLTALPSRAQQAPAASPAPDPALLARARRLHAQVPLVDGHNDLAWEIREKGGSDPARMDPEKGIPALMTDVPRLRAGGVGGVFWAAYVPVEFAGHGAARVALEQIDLIHRMTEHSPAMETALTAADVRRSFRRHRVASLIGIEGGHAIENSLGTLRQFYAMGVRYMTLTHVNTIDWADAATDSARHGGLTPFGEEVVREMNRLGMLVDLSHVSDGTMRDALRVSQAPVIFSHSSARAVADHPRNVPDDVLALLPANGGVVMTNFYSAFVDPQAAAIMHDMVGVERGFKAQHPSDPAAVDAAMDAWRAAHPIPRGSVATVADHVDHLVKVAGIDHVGIGSDFDGISTTPVGLEDVSTFPNLTAELLRRGYADGDVKKILGLNVLRAMEQAERVAARLQRERPPSTRTIEEMDGPARR
jgi:membrane dipeptidase